MISIEWIDVTPSARLWAVAGLLSACHRELIPAEPTLSGDDLAVELGSLPPHDRTHLVIASQGSDVIGAARLVTSRPEVAQIETWNHTVNEAMLHINREMGFHQVVALQEWEIDL